MIEGSVALVGKLIELRSPVVLRKPPLRFNPTLLFQAVKSGVQGPLFDLEHVLGCRLDPAGYGIAVERTPAKGLKNQSIERALE